MADYLIAAVLVIGGVFGLIGSFGLLKLNDPMKRLHAPTKASTIGVGTALIASSIYAAVHGGALSLQEILIVIFLFITSPITAHFLSKAHLAPQPDAPGCSPHRNRAGVGDVRAGRAIPRQQINIDRLVKFLTGQSLRPCPRPCQSAGRLAYRSVRPC